MSKDSTEVLSPDANGQFYFGPVGTPLPTAGSEALNAALESAGYILDPPDFAPDRPTKAITAWNSDDPVRTLIESSTLEVTLKLLQTSAIAIELYWGLGDWVSDGSGGAIWTPESGAVEKAGLLEVTDGDNVLRFVAEKWSVSKIGKMNLARAEGVSYEITLSRQAGDFNILADGPIAASLLAGS